MQLRIIPMLTRPFALGKCVIERRNSGVDVACLRFRLGTAGFMQWQPKVLSLLTQHPLTQAHVRLSGLPLTCAPTCIAKSESACGKIKGQPMLATHGDERFGVRQKPSSVAAQQIQIAHKEQRVGYGREMPCAWRMGERFLGKAPCPRDLAERPKRHSQPDHAGNTDVHAVSEGEWTVQLGIVRREPLFETLPSPDIISLIPKARAHYAMPPHEFGRVGFALGVA